MAGEQTRVTPNPSTAEPEIDQDLPFQQRQWVVQRIGWLLMALIVLGAVAGLTGAGPLSTAAIVTSDDSLEVQFPRFLRAQTTSVLTFDLATSGDTPVEVWIDSEYLDSTRPEFISPDPAETRAGDGRQVFVFTPAAGAAAMRVHFHLQYQNAGVIAGEAGIVGGESVTLRQVVYP